MPVKRNCDYKPLSKQPLALVLAQVRFSPIPKFEGYIPEIQDFLRKTGYPIHPNQQNFVISVGPAGLQHTEIRQWRFETPSQNAMILFDPEQVILETCEYSRFEEFMGEFISIFSAIMKITEHDKYGVFVRLGLRYIDQIRKQSASDDIDSYLRPALRGMDCKEYTADKKHYTLSTVGQTQPADYFTGEMAIRIFRGEKGFDIPPDLIQTAPTNRRKIEKDEDIALVDMDHYWVGSFGPDIKAADTINERFYRLHDTIIKGFHDSVITEEGIAKWK
jgi:uncharacterized protein (TIGR04255 family)